MRFLCDCLRVICLFVFWVYLTWYSWWADGVDFTGVCLDSACCFGLDFVRLLCIYVGFAVGFAVIVWSCLLL